MLSVRKVKIYPNCLMKNAPVLPEFPLPLCDYKKQAWIIQSIHPKTTARSYYTCEDIRLEERYFFFQ